MITKMVWFMSGVVVALMVVFFMKVKCKDGDEVFKGEKGSVVEVIMRDTVFIEKGGLIVKYVIDGKLLDSIEAFKIKIDSLEKNRVLVINEKTKEVIKYIPVQDSLGQRLKDYLDLKNGDKIMKLPAVVEIKDEEGKWLRFRVLIDEKPVFLGGDIVSDLMRRDSVVKDNFWVKERIVTYEQKNPYLGKTDIQYKERKRKYKVLKFLKLKK